MTIGIYAGSFDPVTYGHLNIIDQATKAFNIVIVAVGVNPAKRATFTPEERVGFIREALVSPFGVEVVYFTGLLADFCREVSRERVSRVSIIRGLRAISDFENEMAIAHLNSTINAEVPTVFFPTAAHLSFVSSSAAKEMARYEGAFNALTTCVPKSVATALQAKMAPVPKAGVD